MLPCSRTRIPEALTADDRRVVVGRLSHGFLLLRWPVWPVGAGRALALGHGGHVPASCIPMELFTYNFYALKIVSDALVALVNKMQIKNESVNF